MISLSFTPERKVAILEGRKVCTTRREIHGQAYDRFHIRGQTYQIVDVVEGTLSDISGYYYRFEGFLEPQEFAIFGRDVMGSGGMDCRVGMFIYLR